MKDELAGALSTLGSMQHFTIPGLDTAASLCGREMPKRGIKITQ
jgi:hypothetical protein